MTLSAARSLDALRSEYNDLYASMVVRPERIAQVDAIARRLKSNEARYRSVADPIGVPWFVVGIIHSLEGGGFSAHLHNGDPLTARTTHVPANRPLSGTPPFTWEESARDALAMRGWNAATDWSLAGMLYQLEKYNGFGSRARGIATPYLWSFTNHYTRGKFASDGRYDPNLVSAQAGGAAILRRMSDLGLVGAMDATSDAVPDAPSSMWMWFTTAVLLGGAAYVIATKDRR